MTAASSYAEGDTLDGFMAALPQWNIGTFLQSPLTLLLSHGDLFGLGIVLEAHKYWSPGK